MTNYAKTLASPIPGRPMLEAPDRDIGPGPLSPAWPRPRPAEPPLNEWDAISRELSALRRACWASLNARDPMPFMLSVDERADLDAKLLRIKAGNAALSIFWHMRHVAAWPDPVLPRTVLFGARDLAAFLGQAITAADTLARYTALGLWSTECPL